MERGFFFKLTSSIVKCILSSPNTISQSRGTNCIMMVDTKNEYDNPNICVVKPKLCLQVFSTTCNTNDNIYLQMHLEFLLDAVSTFLDILFLLFVLPCLYCLHLFGCMPTTNNDSWLVFGNETSK